jgi:succinyl-CoA synthetase beta subunit
VLEELGEERLHELLGMNSHMTSEVKKFVYEFFQFFRTGGFVSLEVNPFVVTPHPDPLL